MTILKVLNSSVVLVADDAGEESILLGKGIGYGRKPGQEIVRQPSDKVFIPLSNPDSQQMMELFSEIPPVFLDITQELVREAETVLGEKLSPHIYLLLTDHLHFALERHQKGMVVTNRVFWEIKNFYRKEFAIGLHGLELFQERLGVELPEQEAANIAFHIVNARPSSGLDYDAMKAAKLMGEMMNIVTYSMHTPFNTESIHYVRFVSHLQFFTERFYSGKLLDSADDFLYHNMESSYPDAVACAEKLRTFVMQQANVFLPNEEVAYLALHIARLTRAG